MQKYILPTSFLGMNFLNLSNVIKNKAAIVALEQQGVLHDFWKSFNIKSSWKERTSKRSFYDCNWTQAYNHLVHKQTIKHFVKLVFIFCFYFHFHFFFSYQVTYAFQSESTLYSCLNVKQLLARSRREIWSLSDCN